MTKRDKEATIYYIIMVPLFLVWIGWHLFGDFIGPCNEHLDKFTNKLGIINTSSSATRLANQFIQATQKKEYLLMGLMMDKDADEYKYIPKLSKEFSQIIGEQQIVLSKNELVGFHSCPAKKQIAVTFMHKLTQGKNIFIDLVYKQLDSWEQNITDFHFNVIDGPALDKSHKVSFVNLSRKQVFVGIMWIIIPLLILASCIMSINTDCIKRKWSWMVLILFGIGSIKFDWTGQIFFTKLFSISFLGVGWFKSSCYTPLILELSLPIGALLFLLKVFLVKIYFPNCKNPIINKLLLKYAQYQDRKKVTIEKKHKKYYLDNYGTYHNADELTREEMLEVFWKMLKRVGYDTSSFGSNTSIHEPGKQLDDWEELGAEGFITEITQMFDILRDDIVKDRDVCVGTFGELADLIIRKAKEKKQK